MSVTGNVPAANQKKHFHGKTLRCRLQADLNDPEPLPAMHIDHRHSNPITGVRKTITPVRIYVKK